ncbi:hypothetical protein EST38_g9031 [Candolleomyces aberdarensis]|uniref:Nephrocystin 3-like N-terminal domain-containing protein n=1 Tax=Candolleomyces aberdarensis TaxID=2316362 RepID=A0A4Q2DAY6_9AGAR|nr:hypothetical protein EST38_g9031 [Candolleomyces aberdarensis]
MLGAKRQLSKGSTDADGPPLQRRRSSITQGDSERHGESGDLTPNIYQQPQDTRSMNSPAVYYNQSFSSGPIFNGAIYGNVYTHTHVSTMDGLQFLYQHAATGAMHESDERYPPPLCHPGTRDVVIGRITGWHLVKNDQKKGILWVHAPAGHGKTAIAGTVTERLGAMKGELGFSPVGATFYFWRTSPERNSPARFMITLAYQLAQSIPELQPHVDTAIKTEPAIAKMALERQLVKLIVEPFKSLGNLADIPNRLVIIDGIDECINSDRESRVVKKYAEDQEAVQVRVLDLIHCLHSHHLPLSFLILSRPEAWIKQHLESKAFHEDLEVIDLYKIGDHMNDVAKFVRAELSRIAKSLDPAGRDGKWAEEQKLVWKSGGHMLYAATVIRHIDDPYDDPRKLLRDIINGDHESSPDIEHSTPFSSLYELYRQIMRSCPPKNRPHMMQVLEDVMAFGRTYYVQYRCDEALRLLDRMSMRLAGSGLKALRPLHAVLRIGNGAESIDNIFVHSSFQTFLKSAHLSLEFTVDRNKGQERLLSSVLDRMAVFTMDEIDEDGLGDRQLFALNNWCQFWSEACQGLFRESRATHIRMIEKVIATDFTACFIRSYLNHQHDFHTASPLSALFHPPGPAKFFIGSLKSDECAATLSLIQRLSSHVLSSIDKAFTFLLQATNFPAISQNMRSCLVKDCESHLQHVIAQADWRENKVVQALWTPGHQRNRFVQEVIEGLYCSIWRNRTAQEELMRPIEDAIEEEDSDTEMLRLSRSIFWSVSLGTYVEQDPLRKTAV